MKNRALFTPANSGPSRIWTVLFTSLAVAGLFSPSAIAQYIPEVMVSDASAFEGNTGSTNLTFVVTVFRARTPIDVRVSVTPMSGSNFNAATAGNSCGGAVDFIQQNDVLVTIPPDPTGATFSFNVNVVVCADAVIEPDEHVLISLSPDGAQCFEGGCTGIGTIRNDDGTPTMSVNDISTSEPFSGTKTSAFTVSLSHPTTLSTSVNFATRDGTARGQTTTIFGDYVGNSGTLNIPPNTLSGNVTFGVQPDRIIEATETLFLDLSSPVNATIVDNVGRATIRDTTLTIGGFDLSPDGARVQADEIVHYSVVWTVPEGQVWTDLRTIDFRIRNEHNNVVLWFRWDEAQNLFSACRKGPEGGWKGTGNEAGGGRCAAGELPGSPAVLQTPFAQLHLAGTTVTGSGPTGRSVTLNFAISFGRNAAGHSYILELAASDDFGKQDDFVQVSELQIDRTNKQTGGKASDR